MSIAKLCSVHTYDVLEYVDRPGASMGKSTDWTKAASGVCRVVPLSSGIAGQEFRQRDYTITHTVYWSADPAVANGARIAWTGTVKDGPFASPIVLTLSGPVQPDSTSRLWKATAVAHELANLENAGAKA